MQGDCPRVTSILPLMRDFNRKSTMCGENVQKICTFPSNVLQ